MKYLNLTKSLAVIAVATLVFTACKKANVATPMGDAGQILVKLLGGGTPASIAKRPVDFVATPTRLLAVEVRRDVPNETELNKTMIVTVKDDTAAVTAAGYLHFPAAWFTIETDGVKTGGTGGTFTFTFKPGEFSKSVFINIPNATFLDPSSLYGLGFTVLTADGGAKLSTQKSVVVEIGAKNDWDGVYSNEGTFVDFVNPAFVHFGAPQQYSLITAGASTCVVFNDDLGTIGYLFKNVAANTYFGSYGLVISFNPATGAISSLHNYYGDPANAATPGGNPALGSGAPLYSASNTRRAVLDPSGVNAVQGNKDILIKHWLVQPNAVAGFPPPYIRAAFDEQWKYIGPR